MKFLIVFGIVLCMSICDAVEIVYIDEIRNLPNHPEILLIDVRAEWEVEETGLIPTSINIPIDSLQWAFDLIPLKFYSLYNREQSKKNDPIIFTCKLGIRALRAAQSFIDMGYTNVRYYEGSWAEWCVEEIKICP